jgi:hypothetical protein
MGATGESPAPKSAGTCTQACLCVVAVLGVVARTEPRVLVRSYRTARAGPARRLPPQCVGWLWADRRQRLVHPAVRPRGVPSGVLFCGSGLRTSHAALAATQCCAMRTRVSVAWLAAVGHVLYQVPTPICRSIPPVDRVRVRLHGQPVRRLHRGLGPKGEASSELPSARHLPHNQPQSPRHSVFTACIKPLVTVQTYNTGRRRMPALREQVGQPGLLPHVVLRQPGEALRLS